MIEPQINLGCRDDSTQFKFVVYVTTFLGYGVNEGSDLLGIQFLIRNDFALRRNFQKLTFHKQTVASNLDQRDVLKVFEPISHFQLEYVGQEKVKNFNGLTIVFRQL